MIAIVLFMGYKWITDGSLTVGTIGMFIILIWRCFDPIWRTSEQLSTIQKAIAGSKRIFALLTTESTLPDPEKPVEWNGLKKSIKFENVWFSYTDDKNWALKDATFEIPVGKRMALAGVTGGGKSTVISLLLRLYDPQKGRIMVDGIDIRDIRKDDLRKKFALVLQDIILSGAAKVVELNEIFRQAQESSIIVNAHKINHGILPSLKPAAKELDDFYFIEQEDPEEVLRIILELAKERIPRRFGFHPVNDIQVLSPMHRGTVGAGNLNVELQKALNPAEDVLTRGGRSYRINDKVMQVRNNYDKEVFNGDIGRIMWLDPEKQEVRITFEDREVLYDYPDLDEVVLAYAISVHKSQGSEYPAVIVPVLTQHYVLLQRNLIYTAVTRGRNLVVMVGSRKALAIGVKNDKTQKRYTYLRFRI